MSIKEITVRGARQHNLKNINVDIPRDKFVVITGLSGSGKSSLAFDTIYAEGQRRYVESLSAYARQFLDQLEKPDVRAIAGDATLENELSNRTMIWFVPAVPFKAPVALVVNPIVHVVVAPAA